MAKLLVILEEPFNNTFSGPEQDKQICNALGNQMKSWALSEAKVYPYFKCKLYKFIYMVKILAAF